MKLNGLENYFKTNVNNEIINFKQINYNYETPLMYTLIYNKEENLNLSKEQFDYLIQNSDLKQVDNDGMSPLIYALVNNKSEKLNLSKEQWNYLIKNSDLKQFDKYEDTALKCALENKDNLNLSNEQWKYLISNSDLSLITEEEQLIELKKLQSELLNNEILSKIDINKDNKKVTKI